MKKDKDTAQHAPKKQKQALAQAAPTSKKPPTPRIRDMRKIKAGRALLWTVIILVLVRGLVAIIFPPDTEQQYATLTAGITRVNDSILPTAEASAFAESFAREYFTYTARGIDDYKQRLGRYCSSRLITDLCEGLTLRGGVKATHTTAVDIAEYSGTQQDITVQVVADYITETPTVIDGKELLQPTTTTYTTYIIVPVYLAADGYLVEDMPLIAAPPAKASSYQLQEVSGGTADDRIKQSAETMLGDFFKTLYSEEQRRIDYYLTEDANRSRLREIKSNMRFDKVDTLTVYKGTDANSYTGVVTLRITDPSGSTVRQRLNILLIENGSRLYVKDINLRSHNL